MSNVANRFVVILDANVLYPFGVRDVLLTFAEEGLYRARWSKQILEEMVTAITRRRPDREASILSTRDAMIEAFPEAEVIGHEGLIDALHLPDENDRHVLAAAIRASAQLIVTENLRDFPDKTLAPYDVQTATADDFLVGTFELYQSQALIALRKVRRNYDAPPMNANDFIVYLQRNGLGKLAALVRPDIDAL